MQTFQCVVFLGVLAGAAATAVTPIDKVITLIEGLKAEVESDGKTEAKAYDKFACFCQKTTGTKSKSVQTGTKKIGVLSADIADKTTEQTNDRSELKGRKQDQEDNNRKLDETKTRCAKEKAEYDATSADLSAAIAGLKGAIKSMVNSKPSLIQIKQALGKTFEIAEAMNLLKTPKHKSVAALIQTEVDPDNAKFGFHSDDIIDVCKDLLKDYNAEKKSVDTEYGKTSKACAQLKASLRKKLSANQKAMDALDKNIAKLAKEIAQHRTDLITSQGQLQDDELYLKDLTARCEDRANDYDQRSAMRNDELTAFTTALKVLSGTVKSTSDAVNERALFIQKAQPSTKDTKEAAAPATKPAAVVKEPVKPVSFLQNFLSSRQGLSQVARQQRALDTLRTEGQRLGSLTLTSLAERASADPFKKVKGLIQKLIERLLQESRDEATKKGFCDTELGKARKTRDYRFTEAKDLSAEITGFQAKRDALQQEIKDLKSDIKAETQALKEATSERNDEKAANAKTTKTAKDGLEGVTEAILVLKSFYKQAAKAVFLQASPVTERAGFSGNYGGKQDGAKAIFALLETIQSDFDRTLRKTEEAENTAHREYVDFSQVALSSISGKEMKQKLDEEDLDTTLTNLEQATTDLQTAVDLLDGALKELEELKPTCMDSGMSYAERVAKREEEMKALGKALCQLDEEKVEAECK